MYSIPLIDNFRIGEFKTMLHKSNYCEITRDDDVFVTIEICTESCAEIRLKINGEDVVMSLVIDKYTSICCDIYPHHYAYLEGSIEIVYMAHKMYILYLYKDKFEHQDADKGKAYVDEFNYAQNTELVWVDIGSSCIEND